MIQNLQQYFTLEQHFFLNHISYKMIENPEQQEEYQLNCTDNIQVDINEKGLRLIFTRILKFEPENLFELSVSFGAVLAFEESKKNEVEWDKTNLAEEFKEQGGFVLNNLISRTALQIAQITSSFGQAPLITPPDIAGQE